MNGKEKRRNELAITHIAKERKTGRKKEIKAIKKRKQERTNKRKERKKQESKIERKKGRVFESLFYVPQTKIKNNREVMCTAGVALFLSCLLQILQCELSSKTVDHSFFCKP